MSDVQLYLLEFDSSKTEAAIFASKTAAKLEAKSVTLVELIESLGEYLNSEDASIRIRTIAYISDVLVALPPKLLSRQQRELLNDFILSRIANATEGIGHCARALAALERHGSFDQDRVIKIMNTLLDHTHPLIQFKQQSERFDIVKLLDLLLASYRKALEHLQNSSKNFLSRLVSYFDGEKDPRNLMIIFSLYNAISAEWDVTSEAQDLFDAFFNYFPITFRPPPNDPYGITAQDLKNRLRDCIASTSVFAPHAFPALLDKLDSTGINVKRDALQTIVACVARYGPATLNLYSITLWDSVKFEILSAQEEDLVGEALSVLRSVAKVLSSGLHEGPLENYLRPICKECKEHLDDTPTKQSSASARILGSVSEAAAEVSSFVNKAVLPHLISLYGVTDSTQRRRGLLEVLNELLKSSISTFGRWRKDEAVEAPTLSIRAVPNTLDDFSSQLFELLLSAVTSSPINEVSFRIQALQGLQNLARIRGLLDDDSISAIARMLVNTVINEAPYGKEEIKALSIDTLVDIAHQKPQVAIENALPIFIAQLPDSDAHTEKPFVPVLEAIAKLSAEQQLFSTITIRLKSRLYAALRNGGSEHYVLSLLSAGLYTFLNGAVDLSSPAYFGSFYQDIVLIFLEDIIARGDQNFPQSHVIKSPPVLEMIGKICNVILRAQPFPAQAEICRNAFTLFRTERAEDVAPFQTSDSMELIVSAQLVASLQREAVPHPNLSDLMRGLVHYSTAAHISAAPRNAAVHLASLVVNKYIRTSQTSDLVLTYLQATQAPKLSGATASAQLQVRFAMLKALILRNDPIVPAVFPHFLSSLSDPDLGLQAARAFSTLLAPDEFLTKENHCRIFALHKQRLFYLAVPALVDAFRTTASEASSSPATEAAKSNYLTALSAILQHVPYDLLRPELDRLAPLLLQSLALEATDVKAAAINTLGKIVVENPSVLEQHASSLVTRLLVVATASPAPVPATSAASAENDDAKAKGGAGKAKATSASPPKTRAAALACLASFVGSLKDEVLLPYQRQVVRRLASALDDERRAVRAEAVRCRAAWAGLDSHEDDDDD